MSEKEVSITRTPNEVFARIERTVYILEDATADGLTGFDRHRLQDLVVRDVSEFLLLKKYRASRVAALGSGLCPENIATSLPC